MSKKSIVEAGLFLVAIVAAYFLVSQLLVGTAIVRGDSMTPTLREGDRCLINKFVYRLRNPRRGEIVCVRVPPLKGVSIKRVIALPGETVQIKYGRIWVDSHPLNEPYLPVHASYTTPNVLGSGVYAVDPNSYFVLGDSRIDSLDSRMFGAVRESWIVGRLWMVLW